MERIEHFLAYLLAIKVEEKRPSNKISEDRIDVIKEQIKKFPLHTIHYRREKTRALNI